MAKTKTAVEWLFNQIERELLNRDIDITLRVEKAKQMEKEQIKDAFTDGCIGELYELNAYYTSEKYYNETYGEQEN
jgi:hypothetical protein